MTSNFSNSASNLSSHQCTSVIGNLRHTILREDHVHLNILRDLAIVLEQALFVASPSSAITRCPFCPSVSEIICIAQRIDTKFRSVEEQVLLNLRSTHRMVFISGEFWDDFENDCRMLKELLQSIMDVHASESKSASASFHADMLGGGRDLRFEGGYVTNVSGSSNKLVFIKKEESGVGFRGVLVLFLLAFLVSRLL